MPKKDFDITVEVPETAGVTFRILKDGEPVQGAVVNLCDKSLSPVKYSGVTDENGEAVCYPQLRSPLVLLWLPSPIIIPPDAKSIFEATDWLFIAYIPNSEYAVWRDNVRFKCGETYTFSLRRYAKAPEFFIKMELSDVIGSELFGIIAAEIQRVTLQFAGLNVTRIEGEGTRTITVYFTPPFSEHSPIVIDWGAVWFILEVIAVVVGIIAVLYVVRWTFGESAAVIPWALLLIGGAMLLAALKPPERRE